MLCVWVGCTCNTLKNPRVHSTRPRVYRHHAHMLKHVCAWCRYTRRRFERTHGDLWSGHMVRGREREESVKQVFLTFLSILTGCWVHLLSPIVCLPKPTKSYHALQRFTKETLGSYIYIEKGASSIIERSALARCNVLIIRKRNTLQTICSATFAPFLSCSFFFYFSMTTQ